MKNKIGPIYRILREQKKVKLRDITSDLTYPISKLSDFENGKRGLLEEDIKKLYQYLDLTYYEEDTVSELIEHGIEEIFQHVSFCDGKEMKVMKELNEVWEQAKSSPSYVTFILCEFLIYVFNPKDLYKYEYKIQLLKRNYALLTPFSRQVFYDALGVYYKNMGNYEEALRFFDLGIQTNASEEVLAMLYYHKAMIYIFKGRLYEAREFIEKSLCVFLKELNLKRMIMGTLASGIIESRLGQYDNAEKTYHKILEGMNTVEMPNKIMIYNNLIWNYLLWGRFDQVIAYSEIALKIDPTYANIHVYLSYAYWRLKDYSQARNALKNAQEYTKKASQFENVFMKGMASILMKRPYDSQEKRLLEAYEVAHELHDYQLEVYTLEVLSDISHAYEKPEKELLYRNQAYAILKKQH